MLAKKSRGVASSFSTIVLICGIVLVILAGAFADEAFLQRPSGSSTSTVGATTSSQSQTTSSPSLSQTEPSATSATSTSTTDTTTTTLTSTTTSNSTATSSSTTSTSTSTATTTTSLSTTTSSASTSSSASATSTTTSQPGTVMIVLPVDVGSNESLNFTPSNIKVVIGVNNTIVWNDLDYIQHTVQSIKLPAGAKGWNSGILNEGQLFTITLTVPGTYRYDCSIHPDWMVGTITVVS